MAEKAEVTREHLKLASESICVSDGIPTRLTVEFAKWLEGAGSRVAQALADEGARVRAECAAADLRASAELAADLRKLRWGGVNPESCFYDPAVAAAYARIEVALRLKETP